MRWISWHTAVVVPALARVAVSAAVGALTALLAAQELPDGCGQALGALVRKLFGLS